MKTGMLNKTAKGWVIRELNGTWEIPIHPDVVKVLEPDNMGKLGIGSHGVVRFTETFMPEHMEMYAFPIVRGQIHNETIKEAAREYVSEMYSEPERHFLAGAIWMRDVLSGKSDSKE